MTRRREFRSSVESRVIAREGQGMLQALLEALLSERAQAVFKLRFGLADGEYKTLDEIAVMYGVNRERIRQIINQAIERLEQGGYPVRQGLLDGELIVSKPPVVEAVGCEKHGWRPATRVPASAKICASCPCPLGSHATRTQRFCSDACRQSAYRRRQVKL